MSAFMIFAILLTAAYIIYYAVMIYKDLYGKKIEKTSEDEIFEIENIEEQSVCVRETANGFVVGNPPEVTDDVDLNNRPKNNKAKDTNVAENNTDNPSITKLKYVKDEMQEADIQSECGVTAPDLYDMLLNRQHKSGLFKPDIRIERLEF
jgi:hypothetical protein